MYEMSWYDVMNPGSMLALILITMAWVGLMIKTTYKDLKVLVFFVGCFALAGVYESQSTEAEKYSRSLEYIEDLQWVAEAQGVKLNPFYKAILETYEGPSHDPEDLEVAAFHGVGFNIYRDEFDLLQRFLNECVSGDSDDYRTIYFYPLTNAHAAQVVKSVRLSEGFEDTDGCRSDAGMLLNIFQ